jgi:hypothetical protein
MVIGMVKEPNYRMRLTGIDMHDRVWIPMSPLEMKHIANMYACVAINQRDADFYTGIADKMNKAYELWCSKKGKNIEEHRVPEYEDEDDWNED